MIVMLYLTETRREGGHPTCDDCNVAILQRPIEKVATQHVMTVMLYLTEICREGGHSTCNDCNIVSYRDP